MWKVIKSSGCSHIQDAIEGRESGDFDPEALKKQAEFVLTLAPDWQSAPKKPLTSVLFRKKKP